MLSWPANRTDGISAIAPLLIALACAVTAVSPAAFAQKRSPEIKAEEESDPAAGEVVIINPRTIKKRQRKAAPNPYEPIKLKPLPDVRKPSQKAAAPPPKKVSRKTNSRPPVSRKPASRAPASRKPRVEPPVTGTLARATPPKEALPPLPKFNKTPPQQRARLRQFPQAPLVKEKQSTPPRSRSQTARLNNEEQRLKRKQKAADRRAARESERLDRQRTRNRQFDRRFAGRDYEYRRRFRRDRRWRNRPWRYCRRMAWNCRDGDDEACFLWQRRC
jgi:hypothetical protein